VASVGLLLIACERSPTPGPTPVTLSSAALSAHSAEFERQVIEVAPGVHVAVGFALANVIMIEGDGGVIIVDTTESKQAAREVKRAFDAITQLPVKAIIYTHNHTDHIMGAEVFAPDGNVPVYAHDSTWEHIQRIMTVLRPVIETRSYHMFGNYLARGGEAIVNDGIGPALSHTPGDDGDVFGLLPPTRTFSDTLDVTIAGRRLRLIHSPGETDDQIAVWLPEERILLPGDNVYKAFPNLYTVRGTRYRDVTKWARTVRQLDELGARYLIPSHTRPVTGAENIAAILGPYADAIQYVHDQTVRGMNMGLSPEELSQTVKLPPALAEHPWLQPFYGTVAWSVRSVYSGYLGWFDGNSTHLYPTPERQKAARTLAIMGGAERVLQEAEGVLSEADPDPQWAAELADIVITARDGETEQAGKIKARALRQLAAATPNPNARNWYLSDALELEGKIDIAPAPVSAERVDFASQFPVDGVLQSMAVNLDPKKAQGVDQRAVFVFPDQGKRIGLHVRNQVAVVEPQAATGEALEITVNARDWLALVSGQRSFALAMADGTLQVSGGLGGKAELLQFLNLFRVEQ